MPDEAAYHEQLIAQARSLANPGQGRPRQADLRRAISSAYYALFHFLIDEACREFLGRAPKDRPFRTILSRAFDHGEMAEASKPFKARNLREGLQRDFGQPPASLGIIAEAFVDLQDERHRADYDLAARFRLQETNLLINRAAGAMQGWEGVRDHPTARLYLVMLLAWKQIKTRKIR